MNDPEALLHAAEAVVGILGKHEVDAVVIGAVAQGKMYGAVDWGTMAAVTLGSFAFLTTGVGGCTVDLVDVVFSREQHLACCQLGCQTTEGPYVYGFII